MAETEQITTKEDKWIPTQCGMCYAACGIRAKRHEVKNPKPIKSFIRMMGRFSHLKDKKIQSSQKMVNERLGML